MFLTNSVQMLFLVLLDHLLLWITLVILLCIIHHDIFSDCLHKGFIFSHLLKSTPNIFNEQHFRMICAQLQELTQIFMVSSFLTNASLLEYPIEIFSPNNLQFLLLGLRFNLLLDDDILEVFLGSDLILEQVQHEHDHNLHRLLIKQRQIKYLSLLFLFRAVLVWII